MRSNPNCGSVLVRSCRGLRGLSIEYTDELRRAMPSAKCPDRFSRKVACSANPESFLDCAPLEKLDPIGEGATGEGGDALDEWLLFVVVELVDGLSLPRLLSPRAVTNAL